MNSFPFNEEKAVNAILYILNELGGKCDMHKISKILYFADQKHLIKYGRPVIGDVYIAMPYGPVPSKCYDGFKSLSDPGRYIFPSFIKTMSIRGNSIISCSMPDMDDLSKTDISCLNESIADNRGAGFNDLVDKSHSLAWSAASRNGEISIIDIAKEAACSEDMIEYIKENLREYSAVL